MNIWLNAIGYQVVWFCAVIGAGRGAWWWGPLAAVAFIAWQVAVSPHKRTDLRLLAVALVCGCVLDGVLAATGWARHAAPWPSASFAPVWILSIWASFAVTLTQSLRFLQGHPWLAFALGAIGGPMAYSGAARAFDALSFSEPRWHALAWLSLGWAIAMPLLAGLTTRWVRREGDGDTDVAALRGSAQRSG